MGAFALLMVAAVALLYALILALMALAIPMVGADDVGTVTYPLVEMARFPVQAYRQPLPTILVVVPVALLTTTPAQALLGTLPPWWLLGSALIATTAVVAASPGWRTALQRYSGASA